MYERLITSVRVHTFGSDMIIEFDWIGTGRIQREGSERIRCTQYDELDFNRIYQELHTTYRENKPTTKEFI